KMENQKVHFRHVMLYCFKRGFTASQTLNEMFSVYGDACVTHQTVRKWYRRFEAGDFNMEDQARSGRPQEVDETLLMDLVHENPRVTVRELADTLHKSVSTVHDHL
ncbi:Histone-lysine N-methyltransferase SETMAR, partial [Harpegnathos saltator]